MFLILSLSLYHKLKLVVYQNRFLCNFPLDIHMQFSYKILPVNQHQCSNPHQLYNFYHLILLTFQYVFLIFYSLEIYLKQNYIHILNSYYFFPLCKHYNLNLYNFHLFLSIYSLTYFLYSIFQTFHYFHNTIYYLIHL